MHWQPTRFSATHGLRHFLLLVGVLGSGGAQGPPAPDVGDAAILLQSATGLDGNLSDRVTKGTKFIINGACPFRTYIHNGWFYETLSMGMGTDTDDRGQETAGRGLFEFETPRHRFFGAWTIPIGSMKETYGKLDWLDPLDFKMANRHPIGWEVGVGLDSVHCRAPSTATADVLAALKEKVRREVTDKLSIHCDRSAAERGNLHNCRHFSMKGPDVSSKIQCIYPCNDVHWKDLSNPNWKCTFEMPGDMGLEEGIEKEDEENA